MSLSGKDRDAIKPEIARSVVAQAPEASGAPPALAGRQANTGLVIVFMSLAGLSYAVLQSLVAPALPVMAGELMDSTLRQRPGRRSWVRRGHPYLVRLVQRSLPRGGLRRVWSHSGRTRYAVFGRSRSMSTRTPR
jgi:hypothetical protein